MAPRPGVARPRRRRAETAGAAVLLLAVLGVAGCGTDTAAERQRQVRAASTETEQMLGRSFTTVRPGGGPGPCSTADGNSPGYDFSLDQRRARLDADRIAVAKQIEAFWRTKNYDVESYTDNEVTRIRAGFAAGQLDLRLGITTNEITLLAHTKCAREAGT